MEISSPSMCLIMACAVDVALEITERCKESVREMGQGIERQKSKLQEKKVKKKYDCIENKLMEETKRIICGPLQ